LSKDKSRKAEGMPRSKAARQKLRRWTFAATIKLENGQVQGFNLPGVVYGNSAEAKQTAEALLKQFKSDPKAPQDAEVTPQGHETVSQATVRQLQGMNDQANLFNKTAFILAEKYRLASTTDKEIVQIVTEAVEEARQFLFPRLREAQAKVAALETAAAVPAATPATEEPKPKRKLGIDAVREILDGPAEAA